jgi:carbon starvation protein
VSIATILVCAVIFLAAAYILYGTFLSRVFRLDPKVETPSVTLRDDIDFVPIESKFLLGQHFSAIAAAGPIVGPIIAGSMFGWGPALLWILIGSVFVGGVQDFAALVASIRHKARSITEIVKQYMSHRAYILFLIFIWITVVYVVVAFTDITASSFVGLVKMENGEEFKGGAIAASSMMYLALPIIMGLLMRYAKLSLLWATIIFLPLVGVAIWAGKYMPLSMDDLMLNLNFAKDAASAQIMAIKAWDVLLLAYCYVAALLPMWLLLQPRGHLGGFFLYVSIFAGAIGLLLAGSPIKYPMFIAANSANIFPMLFILIACGACSGFHTVIASGTTSKQLKHETDAKLVGYGAMLLEAVVAVIALCCVIILAHNDPMVKKTPNFIYATGLSIFMGKLGVPIEFGISFGLLAFTTFVYDTLDVCTRLGRYIIEEVTNWRTKWGRLFATLLTAGIPLLFVMKTTFDPVTKLPIPAWKYFWALFGATNQILGALALIGLTVWVMRAFKSKMLVVATAVPTVFMLVTSITALFQMVQKGFLPATGFTLTSDPVPWVALLLIVLSVFMLIEGIRALTKFFNEHKPSPKPLSATSN